MAEVPPPPTPPAPPAPPAHVLPSADVSYRQRHPPQYPPRAIRQRHEGTVLLKILVGVDGTPKEVRVKDSSGYRELDRAAVRAAKNWQFNPGTRNGVPYEGWVVIPVDFNLRGGF